LTVSDLPYIPRSGVTLHGWIVILTVDSNAVSFPLHWMQTTKYLCEAIREPTYL